MFGLALHIVVLKHRFEYTNIFLVDVSLLFAFYIIWSHLHRKARMQCLYGADTQGWICHWKKSICKMCCNFWENPNDLAPISFSRESKYESNSSCKGNRYTISIKKAWISNVYQLKGCMNWYWEVGVSQMFLYKQTKMYHIFKHIMHIYENELVLRRCPARCVRTN